MLPDGELITQKARMYLQSTREKVEELIHILETEKPLQLTQQEQWFIKHPSPIVWGSLTARPETPDRGLSSEKILRGPQKLGKDIQLLFVEEDESLQAYLKEHLPQGVHVLPIKLLR